MRVGLHTVTSLIVTFPATLHGKITLKESNKSMGKIFVNLPTITPPEVNDADLFAIEDISIPKTKAITVANLRTTILSPNSVATATVQDAAITPAKIAPQEAWITPTLLNDWVYYDYGPEYDNAGYYKDSMGIVHLRGLIKSGTSGDMFVLPVGYRPLMRKIFPQICGNNTLARVDVSANGTVSGQVSNNAWVSLEGITFRAEQ